jgi:hypothetical protein
MFMAPEHVRAAMAEKFGHTNLLKFRLRTMGHKSKIIKRAEVRLRTGHQPIPLTVLNQEVTGAAARQAGQPKSPKRECRPV